MTDTEEGFITGHCTGHGMHVAADREVQVLRADNGSGYVLKFRNGADEIKVGLSNEATDALILLLSVVYAPKDSD